MDHYFLQILNLLLNFSDLFVDLYDVNDVLLTGLRLSKYVFFIFIFLLILFKYFSQLLDKLFGNVLVLELDNDVLNLFLDFYF